MHKLRRWLSISLIISMVFLLPMRVSAQTTPAQVNFVASSLDANNNFTVTMTISNATFQAFQFSLRYDKEKIAPIDYKTKQTTDQFALFALMNEELKTNFWQFNTSINSSSGIIGFATCLNPENSFSFSAPTIENSASIGDSPLLFYTFYFRQLEPNGYLEIARKSDTKQYDETFPEGFIIGDGERAISAVVTVDMSKSNMPVYEQEYIDENETNSETIISEPIIESPIVEGSEDTEGSDSRPKDMLERFDNTIIFQIGNSSALIGGVLTGIDKQNTKVVPYIKDDRTLVPVRFLAEGLGISTVWNAEERSVSFKSDNDIVKLVIGQSTFWKNEDVFTLDSPPEIISDRTMVPIRFIVEAFDYNIQWLSDFRYIIITEKDSPWLIDNPIEKNAINEVSLLLSPLVNYFFR